MKISLNWIKEFVDIPAKYSPKELAELLTLRTCEVEGYEDQGRGLEGVVVGQMLEFHKHPNADKLNVAKVDIGRKEPLNLIFGQMVKMNMGDKIPVAVAPTVLPTGTEIVARDMRGVKSEGMLCLEQELGFKEEGVSILYFPHTKPGTPLTEALGMSDVLLDIDNKSLTHRPDLWSHYGMAREFAAFLGKKLKDFVAKNPNPPKNGAKVKVTVASKVAPTPRRGVQPVASPRLGLGDILKRFMAVIITDVRVEESPTWIKNRLMAVGMRPVNNIVDITNYVMLELGQPMHAFDRRTVENDHLSVRFAKPGEVITTLDHKPRQLSPEDALVTNGEKALGIAGVMGGANSEITPQTTEIILEAATWNPIMIRKTAQRHGLRTDAAQRFEKSLDPEFNGIAFHRACELIRKICPDAKMAGPVTDFYPQKAKPISVLLETARVSKKIGVELSEAEMTKHLKALQFGVKKAKKGFLKVEVPTFRATKDVSIEEDLVEEVARMYGYEKIAPVLPQLPIKLPRENRQRQLKHRARQVLSLGLGFNETTHYSFYGAQEVQKCLLPESLHLQVQNPLTEDQTHLRISMLPNILKSVAVNLHSRSAFKLYEVGRTYVKEMGKKPPHSGAQPEASFFPREEKFICGVVVRPAGKKEIFYDALGSATEFLNQFHMKARVDAAETPPPYAHPAKCASLKIDNKEVVAVYEVHPLVLKNFGIDVPVAAFELNFTRFAALQKDEFQYRPLARFPGIEIDVSVLVPQKTTTREVQELIRKTNQPLITHISLRDIFEDKNLGEGKKSLTFRILLQSPDRTLTDAEMKQTQDVLGKALAGRGFIIR